MGGPSKILIIDDSPVFVELEKSLFADLPYVVLTAGGGKEGLAKAFAERPDLILLDEEMPDVPGHEVLALLRAEPASRRTPVILVTGATDDALIDRCMRLGVADCVRKPFEPEALLRRVGKALGLAERKAVTFLVRLRHGGESSFVRAVDLSTTGMRVEHSKPLPAGERVGLEFFLPGSKSQVRLTAEVARRLHPMAGRGDATYGLRFEDATPDVVALIEATLRGRS